MIAGPPSTRSKWSLNSTPVANFPPHSEHSKCLRIFFLLICRNYFRMLLPCTAHLDAHLVGYVSEHFSALATSERCAGWFAVGVVTASPASEVVLHRVATILRSFDADFHHLLRHHSGRCFSLRYLSHDRS